MHFFTFKDMNDDQLFIDFKLDYEKPSDVEVFKMVT